MMNGEGWGRKNVVGGVCETEGLVGGGGDLFFFLVVCDVLDQLRNGNGEDGRLKMLLMCVCGVCVRV